MRCRIFETQLYKNYHIIKMYINKSSTTTHIFITMNYLIMMSEKYLYFRKRKKIFVKDIFYPPHRSNWIHVFGNIFRIMYLAKYVQKFKINWNNSGRIKADNFRESLSF